MLDGSGIAADIAAGIASVIIGVRNRACFVTDITSCVAGVVIHVLRSDTSFATFITIRVAIVAEYMVAGDAGFTAAIADGIAAIAVCVYRLAGGIAKIADCVADIIICVGRYSDIIANIADLIASVIIEVRCFAYQAAGVAEFIAIVLIEMADGAILATFVAGFVAVIVVNMIVGNAGSATAVAGCIAIIGIFMAQCRAGGNATVATYLCFGAGRRRIFVGSRAGSAAVIAGGITGIAITVRSGTRCATAVAGGIASVAICMGMAVCLVLKVQCVGLGIANLCGAQNTDVIGAGRKRELLSEGVAASGAGQCCGLEHLNCSAAAVLNANIDGGIGAGANQGYGRSAGQHKLIIVQVRRPHRSKDGIVVINTVSQCSAVVGFFLVEVIVAYGCIGGHNAQTRCRNNAQEQAQNSLKHSHSFLSIQNAFGESHTRGLFVIIPL
jgi:hypothetical protein